MLFVWLLACSDHDRELSFPSVLEPLEEVNQAPERDPDQGEGFNVVSGEDDDWFWAHGRGLVRTDSTDTWEAMRTPLVHIDRRWIDSWDIADDVEPDFTDSFRIANTMNMFITLTWEVVYVFEVQEGLDAAPDRAVAMWDLSHAPDSLEVLRGSAILSAVDEEWTEVELIYHLKVPMQGVEACDQLVKDIGEDWVDTAHGRTLVEYD